MSKGNLSVASALLLTLLSSAANAEADYYLGIGYTVHGTKEAGVPDLSLSTIAVRPGISLNDYLAVEARVGIGVQDDTVTAAGIGVALELSSYYGVYVRTGFPVGDKFYPYLALGYADITLEGSSSGITVSGSDSDTSYGIGADIRFGEDNSKAINFEYASYLSGATDIDGFSVGFVLGF